MFERITDAIVELILKDESFIDFASYPLRGTQATGVIVLKSEYAVLSGSQIVKDVLRRFSIESEFYYNDGDVICQNSSNIIAKLSGDAYDLLICERTILNVLSFMSSVATKVRRLVDVTKQANLKIKIAATRKTIPFAGELQKLAVIHGGGDTHRLNLSDCAMIKDNHIKLYGSISKAVEEVRKNLSFTKKIEVEVEDEEMAFEACKAGADIIMLDNFKLEKACKVAKKIKEQFPHVLIEISGGVNPDNIQEYLCNYVDVISIGKITSEVKYIDFSFDII